MPDLPWAVAGAGIFAVGSKIYHFGGMDYDHKRMQTNSDRRGKHLGLGSRLLVLDFDNPDPVLLVVPARLPLHPSPGFAMEVDIRAAKLSGHDLRHLQQVMGDLSGTPARGCKTVVQLIFGYVFDFFDQALSDALLSLQGPVQDGSEDTHIDLLTRQ